MNIHSTIFHCFPPLLFLILLLLFATTVPPVSPLSTCSLWPTLFHYNVCMPFSFYCVGLFGFLQLLSHYASGWNPGHHEGFLLITAGFLLITSITPRTQSFNLCKLTSLFWPSCVIWPNLFGDFTDLFKLHFIAQSWKAHVMFLRSGHGSLHILTQC